MDMVKVFPANLFGPEYFKEIKGPFRKIELLACGGVTAENIQSFFSCGASGASFGGSIFKPEWLKNSQYPLIGESLKTLLNRFLGWRNQA